MRTPRVVIVVEGGVVQNVLADLPVDVLLVDHDLASEGEDALPACELYAEVDPGRVKEIWDDPDALFE